MLPNRADIMSSIVSAINEIQLASGRSCEGIGEGTQILAGVPGFDSLNGLEVLASVSAQLRTDLGDDVLGPAANGEAVTVGALADRILLALER